MENSLLETPVMPRDSSLCSHFLNSSMAAVAPSGFGAGAGAAGTTAGLTTGLGAGFGALTLGLRGGGAAPGGALTFPPAPTVAQPLPGAAGAAPCGRPGGLGLLARSA